MLCSWGFSFDALGMMGPLWSHTNGKVMEQSILQDSSHSSNKEIAGHIRDGIYLHT